MRQNRTLEIHIKTPWSFSDGKCKGNPWGCGAGGALFLSNSLHFSFKLVLGKGSNNWTELKALAALLRTAIEQAVNCSKSLKIQIFQLIG